jgi:hypothetical protein
MTEEQKGRGRPKGKKSDPDYTTLTAYIKVTTYKALKKRCVDLDVQMSEVVQRLLDDWLDHQ